MKVPAAPPSGNDWSGVLRWLRSLASAVAAGWNVEHRSDGTHDWHWTAIPYSADTYFGEGAMTWTMAADGQQLLEYALQGDLMFVRFRVVGITVGGTANRSLRIRLPLGYRANGWSLGAAFVTDVTVAGMGTVQAFDGNRYLSVFNGTFVDWTLGSGTNAVGTILLRVAKD